MPYCLLSALGKTSAGVCRVPNTLYRVKSLSKPASAQRTHSVATMASLQYGRAIELNPPSGQHKSTVIMLHGLGDTGDGWADIGYMFSPQLPNTKFIFPTAPRRPITVNGGYTMTGWFDIASLEDIDAEEDVEGYKESKRYVEELVRKEVAAGVPSDKIVVAGFSQGGAIALLMLRSDTKLGGIIGLSTWLALRNETPLVSEANKQTPVFMGHGNADMVVRYDYGKASYLKLEETLGDKVEFETYANMGHSACQSELDKVKAFIQKVVT